jgi:xanthine dehydrogenase iron-sulfur cluster and FAD-binding subunit A
VKQDSPFPVNRGALEVTTHDGAVRRYGDPAAVPVRVRLTDAATAGRIARNPALGAGEAFVDGRLVIESGDVLGLLDLVSGNLCRCTGYQNIVKSVLRAAEIKRAEITGEETGPV